MKKKKVTFTFPLPENPGTIEIPIVGTEPMVYLKKDLFQCPKEIEVYIHADRHLPQETEDALKELIRCALKLLESKFSK